MRVVIDTNVLVSALLSPHGAPAGVVALAVAGQLQLCADGRLWSEYVEVLARPRFAFDPAAVTAVLDCLHAQAVFVAASPWPDTLPHPADAMLLEVASAANAVAVITGNTAHLPEHARRRILVQTPGEFLAVWRARQADA